VRRSSHTIFEGGLLQAKRRGALDHDSQALKAQYDALTVAQASLDLIRKQYDAGCGQL